MQAGAVLPIDSVDYEPHLPLHAAHPQRMVHETHSGAAAVKRDIGGDSSALQPRMLENSVTVSNCKILFWPPAKHPPFNCVVAVTWPQTSAHAEKSKHMLIPARWSPRCCSSQRRVYIIGLLV